MWEVQFALAVAVDMSCEAVVTQVFEGGVVEECQAGKLSFGETEVLNSFEYTGRTCDNAIAALVRKTSTEDLESALALCGAVGKR